MCVYIYIYIYISIYIYIYIYMARLRFFSVRIGTRGVVVPSVCAGSCLLAASKGYIVRSVHLSCSKLDYACSSDSMLVHVHDTRT